MSSELLQKIDSLLRTDIVTRHSYFQLKHFIVGQEPTHQARMWQCLRELKNRRDSVAAIKMEVDDTNDKLALLDIEEQRIKVYIHDCDIPPSQYVPNTDEAKSKLNDLNIAEHEIKLRRLDRQRLSLKESLSQLKTKQKNNLEECAFFVQAFEGLEKIAPLKPFDDLESQKEYWNTRLTEEINMRMILHQPLDIELMKTVLALHNDSPIKKQAIGMIEQQKSRMLAASKEEEE
jgi:hypothetical protein